MCGSNDDLQCGKCHGSWSHGWDSVEELVEFLAGGVFDTGRKFRSIQCLSCGHTVKVEGLVANIIDRRKKRG